MRVRLFIAALATATTLTGASVAATLVPGTALSATPAGATSSAEANLLALTNQARASAGAPALTLDAGISNVARSWAQTMASQGDILHNPDIGSLIGGWVRLAENVGVGTTIDQIHNALLASPSHYANLSNPAYSLVGIGVVSGGGRLYVVEDFEAPGGGRSQPAPVAEPEPPAPVVREAPPTTTPPPPPPAPVVQPAPPPPPAPVAAPRPDPGVTSFPFVLDALRALDALHSHH